MTDIRKLSRKELKDLLSKLQLLGNLQKDLGKRGRDEFHKIEYKKDILKIEYFESTTDSLSYIQTIAGDLYLQLFQKNPSLEEIDFVKNQQLQGGLRIFCNDNMFDMSYSKYQTLLK